MGQIGRLWTGLLNRVSLMADGYEEAPQQETPVVESENGRVSEFRMSCEEERKMWDEWNARQQQTRDAEMEAERMRSVPGTWTGG